MNISTLKEHADSAEKDSDGFINYTSLVQTIKLDSWSEDEEEEQVSLEACTPSFALHTFYEADMNVATLEKAENFLKVCFKK